MEAMKNESTGAIILQILSPRSYLLHQPLSARFNACKLLTKCRPDH